MIFLEFCVQTDAHSFGVCIRADTFLVIILPAVALRNKLATIPTVSLDMEMPTELALSRLFHMIVVMSLGLIDVNIQCYS